MPDKSERETRNFILTELRVVQDDNKPIKLRGYAAVFDQLSENLGGFREKIAPGAFTKTISEADVRALWNHDPNYVLGRSKSGTLSLWEDAHGLKIEIIPPDAQWAKDLMQTIQRGDVDQMSFAFTVVKDTWSRTEGQDPIRTLEEVKLFDVSPVTYPAYPQTSIQARDIEGLVKQSGATTLTEPDQTVHSVNGAEASTQTRLDMLRKKIDLSEADVVPQN